MPSVPLRQLVERPAVEAVDATTAPSVSSSSSTSSAPLPRRGGTRAGEVAKSRLADRGEAREAIPAGRRGMSRASATRTGPRRAPAVHAPSRTAQRLGQRIPHPMNRGGTNSPNSKHVLRQQYQRALAYRRAMFANYSSGLVSRMELAEKAGYTFGNNRVLDKALGRVEPGKIKPEWYEHRYKRGGIAGAIVDKLVNTALRSGATIVEGDGSDTRNNDTRTSWETQIDNFFERLDVWEVLRQAFIDCRKGRYSIIVIGTARTKGDEVAGLDKELGTVPGGLDGITYLKPFPETAIDPFLDKRKLITDASSPMFGYPRVYNVTLGQGLKQEYHYSRVIHISSSLGPWCSPVLERVWDDLDDLDKEKGGIAEGTFQNANAKGVWGIDPNVEFESDEIGDIRLSTAGGDLEHDDDPATIEETMAAWRHGAIDDAIVQGIKRVDTQVRIPDGSNNIKVAMRLIAAGTNYPERVLYGTEEGKLAGEQDSAAYADDVKGYREGFCTRQVRKLIEWLDEHKAIANPPIYTLHWTSAEKSTLAEKGEVIANIAKANKDQQEADGRSIVEPDEMRRDVMGYEALGEEARVVDNSPSVNIRLNALDDDAAVEVVRLDDTINEFESKFTRLLNRAIKNARSELATDGSNIDEVVTAYSDTFTGEGELEELLLAVHNSHARVELEAVEDNGTFLRTATSTTRSTPIRHNLIDISFDEANPRAVDWAAKYASDVIDDLSNNARNVLNSLISTATEQGFTTRQIVAQMSNAIGLDDFSQDHVNKLSSKMLNSEVGTTVKYGTRKVVVDGTLAQVDDTVTGYMKHLLQVRKKRLSRSLLGYSANEGLFEVQLQAKEQDLLPDNVVRVYIENTLRHASRGGTTVAVGERFETEPGHDANCGCTSGLQHSR